MERAFYFGDIILQTYRKIMFHIINKLPRLLFNTTWKKIVLFFLKDHLLFNQTTQQLIFFLLNNAELQMGLTFGLIQSYTNIYIMMHLIQ